MMAQPVIPAPQEVEFGRFAVQSQPRKKVKISILVKKWACCRVLVMVIGIGRRTVF
jgi:hypothetical protein